MANTLNADVRRVVVEFLTLADMHPVRLAARGWHEAVAEFATFQHSAAVVESTSGDAAAVINITRWVEATHAWGIDPDTADRKEEQLATREGATSFAATCFAANAVDAPAWTAANAPARCADANARRCIAFVDWRRQLTSAGPLGHVPKCQDAEGGGSVLDCALCVDLNAPIASAWLRTHLPTLTTLTVGCESEHRRRLCSVAADATPGHDRVRRMKLIDLSPRSIVPAASVPCLKTLVLKSAEHLGPSVFGGAWSVLFPQLTELDVDGCPPCRADAVSTAPALPHLRKLRLADDHQFADHAAAETWPFAAFLRSCSSVTEVTLEGSFAALVLHGGEMVPSSVMAVAELALVTDLSVSGAACSSDGREAARLLARLAPSRSLTRVHIDGLISDDIDAFVRCGQFPNLESVNGSPV